MSQNTVFVPPGAAPHNGRSGLGGHGNSGSNGGFGRGADAEPIDDVPLFSRPQPTTRSAVTISSLGAGYLDRIRTAVSARRAVLVIGVAAIVAAAVVGTAVARRSDNEPSVAAVSLPLAAASELPLEVAALSSAAAVVPGSVSPLASVSAGTPSSSVPTAAMLVVHAAGAVRVPGVYRLADPARVDDVVRAAGGLSAEADLDALNLAARVGDGERIFVPRRGQTPPSVVVGGGAAVGFVGAVGAGSSSVSTSGNSGGTTVGAPIDINAATAEQLDALPGIGPAIAARIVDHRAKIGRFRTVNQLLDVPGIGDAKFASLKSKVRV
jgi:competence protein ComEA